MRGGADGGRYELKYVLPETRRAEVLAAADRHCRPDPHGQPLQGYGTRGYEVHSLYFDTADLHDYTERLLHRRIRVRLRIRTYGRPGSAAPVYLEDKRKVDIWVLKQRVRICDADTWRATPGPAPWAHWGAQVSGAGAYVAHHFLRRVDGEGRSPVSVVHYTREVFIDRRPERRDVRLTLDHDVRATSFPTDHDLYAPSDVELLPAGLFVLELKFARDEPIWMRHMVRELGLLAEPVSKFGLSVACGRRHDRPDERRQLTPRTALRYACPEAQPPRPDPTRRNDS